MASKSRKDGMAPIYVRITVKGDRDGFSSGKKIHPDFWDKETATADRACPDSKFINSYITKTKAELITGISFRPHAVKAYSTFGGTSTYTFRLISL